MPLRTLIYRYRRIDISTRAAQQIVGRERRERVSHHNSSGDAFMKSRRRVNSTVMWHRFLMNGLAAAQYLSYFLVGALYYLIFGALAGVSAGFGLVGLALIFVPALLGGYASGLSFFMPRVSAVIAMIIGGAFMFLGISDFFHGTIQADPFFVIPSAVVLMVSLIVLLWSDGSVWRRTKTKIGRISIVVVAAPPALFATWALGSVVFWLFRG